MSATSHATRLLSLPDKPSIAVLPFANMSGDADQEYFADGDRHRFRRVFRLSETNSVDPHRSSNVFEALVTQIVKCEVEPTRSVFLNTGRNADPARIGQTFEPSRNVHAVTEDVSVWGNA
jgi:hypothetical protein